MLWCCGRTTKDHCGRVYSDTLVDYVWATVWTRIWDWTRLQQQSCVAEEMGTSQLWVIDRDGRVFLFNLRDKSWREISTPKLGSRNCFKRISAVEQCAWAISASQQPYLFVHATELPIRVKVETYENQRWGPIGGWAHTEKSVTTFAFVILIIIFNNQLPTLVPLRDKRFFWTTPKNRILVHLVTFIWECPPPPLVGTGGGGGKYTQKCYWKNW